MYKAKDLEDLMQPMRISNENASAVTVDNIKQLFAGMADENSIPFTFGLDEVKYGGLLNSEIVPALVITHPEHPRDYYGILVAVQSDSGTACVHVYSVGKSKQMKKFAVSETGKQQRKGQSLSFKLGNMAVTGLMSLGKSKDKLAAEQAWYDAVIAIIDSTME